MYKFFLSCLLLIQINSFGQGEYLIDQNVTQVSLGISNDTNVIRVKVNVSSKLPQFLIIPKSNIDFVETINTTTGSFYVAGQQVSKKRESVKDPYFIYPVNSGDVLEIKLKSNEQLVVPLVVMGRSELDALLFNRNIFGGIFIGILGGLVLYNLILFFFLKERNYLYYVLYLIFIGIAQLDIIGFNYYIFGDFSKLNNTLLHYCSGLSGIFGMIFFQRFMNIKKFAPVGHKVLNFIAIIYLLVIILVSLGFGTFSYQLIQLGGFSVPATLIIAIYLASKGHSSGRYIAIAYFVLIVGVVLYALKDFGTIPFNTLTIYTFPIGVALQAILLSFALAHQINTLKKDNETTHLRVVQEIEKNEELVLNQNITLEQKVIERTAALQKALDDLKATQSQLVQSEKMASLGILTAGIAHEINNPINFVSANVIPLRENISDITKLIGEYKSIDFSNLKSELKRLAGLEEELELDYMLTETKQLIDGIEEGAKRTHTIVEGLTSFSRGDMVTRSGADINRGIRSTIYVLKSRLNNVKLITNLDKNLPMVSCQIGKINQVVLNLMNNALDALEEKNGSNRKASQLTVETKDLGDSVQIIISDNANGIEKELQRKIMEPFYTTKEVGKGTGLGLSISYSIIEDHMGAIEIDSEMGVGTKFIITLPLVS